LLKLKHVNIATKKEIRAIPKKEHVNIVKVVFIASPLWIKIDY